MHSIHYEAMYVGHGALNYIEVRDADGTVDKTIIVDAGSTSDYLGIAHQSRDSMKQKVLQLQGAGSLIICITHIHEDHYSFLTYLLYEIISQGKIPIIDAIYLGGVKDDAELYMKAYSLFMLVSTIETAPGTRRVEILGKREEPETLWKIDNDVEFELLFSGLVYPDTDTNSNSANFGIYSWDKHTGIWFTGDSTGKTFMRLMNNENLASLVGWAFGLNNGIVMTVPHHGSIRTLEDDNFVSSADKINWTYTNWTTLCENKVGITGFIYVASFGANDMHSHPSGTAIYAYSLEASQIQNKDPNERYQAFVTYVNEPKLLYDANNPLLHPSYVQYIPNRDIRTTCSCYGGAYHKKTVSIDI